MTALELFGRLAPILGPLIEAECQRRDLCILTARCVLDIARYFGVDVREQPVRAMLYNRIFEERLLAGDITREAVADGSLWAAGAHSVGVGFGMPAGHRASHSWNGHLIVCAEKCFGDFAIQQAERPTRGVVTGPAVVGAWNPGHWKVRNEHATVIEYETIDDETYRRAPDWREEKRRRPIVGRAIRAVKAAL